MGTVSDGMGAWAMGVLGWPVPPRPFPATGGATVDWDGMVVCSTGFLGLGARSPSGGAVPAAPTMGAAVRPDAATVCGVWPAGVVARGGGSWTGIAICSIGAGQPAGVIGGGAEGATAGWNGPEPLASGVAVGASPPFAAG
ncbi:hypothetical protein [Fuscovulum ytuae]|uniref:Uncharacterized protein n=1 Tax=Fuscovulum ytuae TaxID=3042299 RepID=A0ABY8Q319_9RHOB|nr:hypothetical protein [Fuscovulum sp. YMD61]WGV15245.1 hypothetical protein QF092_13310 [Fuscovulum sp. YMD61]